MRGKHIIKVRNRRIQFTLEIERNITIIRGDSATGKTTLIDLLRDYEAQGNQSGVTLETDKPCHVLTNIDWEENIGAFEERDGECIFFVDEGNRFVSSQQFAQAIQKTKSHYVLITRESLHQLPYSVEAVLELRKTTSKSRCTYNKAYPYYKTLYHATDQLGNVDRILSEDSNAGYQMYSRIAEMYGISCDTANGKSNIYAALEYGTGERSLVVADGAAFGADIDRVYMFQKLHPNQVILYLPESFEWLILRAGIVHRLTPELEDILNNPSRYIDSAEYLSWEQFFTRLLITMTSGHEYMRYNKRQLTEFYLQERNVQRILEAMEAE